MSAVTDRRDALAALGTEVLVMQSPPSDTSGGCGFRLGETIGEGAMGIIQTAEQFSLGREVAIKRVKPGKHDAMFSARLHGEAALLGHLDHPNIPPVHLLGMDEGGRPALVMKRITGVPWKAMVRNPDHRAWQRVKGERIPWLIRVFIQVCHAVEYAHSRGILHLDIKAENIMIGEYGEVYLIDWGISEWFDSDAGVCRNSFAGTPSHAAPEMFCANTHLNRQTDVYLLGATLIECLIGRGMRRSSDLAEIFRLAMEPPDVNFPDAVHPHLQAICFKAVAVRPSERYQSADDLIHALSGHLDLRDALDMVHEGAGYLKDLRIAVDEDASDQTVSHLGFQCRFTFEQALRKSSSLKDARSGVLDTLQVLLEYRVSKGEVEHARRLLAELHGLGVDRDRLERAERLVTEASSQRQRADEIATQIQYKLMEQLQAETDKDRA